MSARRQRALGLLLGFAADRLLGDPRRGHPVAVFGSAAAALERRLWRDRRAAGVVHVVVLVGGAVALGRAADHRGRHPALRTTLTAAATWTVLGGTSLDREVAAVAQLLGTGRLKNARVRLTHLVGRDTSRLTEEEVARAALESLAENTSDAVVAPLVWGAVAGPTGLLAYRAANTLDAMVGHRSTRYRRFGWAAARLDDLLNLPGSRLTAALTVLLAPTVGGAPREAWQAWRRDAAAHPSPNAGPVEASFAGALGVRLGGSNTYGPPGDQWVEHRAVMGSGRGPGHGDLERARRLARRVGVAAVVLSAVGACPPAARSR